MARAKKAKQADVAVLEPVSHVDRLLAEGFTESAVHAIALAVKDTEDCPACGHRGVNARTFRRTNDYGWEAKSVLSCPDCTHEYTIGAE